MASPKITEVSYEEFTDDEFLPPSKFYIKNALGGYVFIHTHDRAVAQQTIDEIYGKAHYTVAAAKQQKSTKGLTVRGTINSKSRAGMRK